MWRINRTARCTGGAMYGPALATRLGLRLSRMSIRLVLDEFGHDSRNFSRLLLAHRMARVIDLAVAVAPCLRERGKGAAHVLGQRDAILHADDHSCRNSEP